MARNENAIYTPSQLKNMSTEQIVTELSKNARFQALKAMDPSMRGIEERLVALSQNEQTKSAAHETAMNLYRAATGQRTTWWEKTKAAVWNGIKHSALSAAIGAGVGWLGNTVFPKYFNPDGSNLNEEQKAVEAIRAAERFAFGGALVGGGSGILTSLIGTQRPVDQLADLMDAAQNRMASAPVRAPHNQFSALGKMPSQALPFSPPQGQHQRI